MSPQILLAVAAGGALGAAGRHAVSHAALRWLGPGFPWGTLAVNVAGSFAMGLLIAAFARAPGPVSPELRAFLSVGVLGAFTTFSTFSLDVIVLVERKAHLAALGYAGASVAVSILALAAGLLFGRAVL